MVELKRDLLDEDGENRALRTFLMQYGLPGLTVGAMEKHMRRSGWGEEYVPPFARSPVAEGMHLTKGGAQVWIRHLLSLEPSPSTASTQQDQANVLPPFAAPAGQQDDCDAAFDKWYAAQSHQLTNEQLCRLIWQRGWQACERTNTAGAAKGGNTSTSVVESSTAPTVEADEPDHDAEMFAMLEADAAQEGAIHEMEGAMLWAAHQGWLCAQRASKPPAREAAERQSIDTPMLRQLLVDYKHAESLGEQHMRITEIIAHIDTWGGAAKGESDGR